MQPFGSWSDRLESARTHYSRKNRGRAHHVPFRRQAIVEDTRVSADTYGEDSGGFSKCPYRGAKRSGKQPPWLTSQLAKRPRTVFAEVYLCIRSVACWVLWLPRYSREEPADYKLAKPLSRNSGVPNCNATGHEHDLSELTSSA
jgi:hypothetical protein